MNPVSKNKTEFVTTESCTVKHNSTKYILGGILLLCTVFLALTVFAVNFALGSSNSSMEAIKETHEIQTQVEVHIAQDIEQDKAVYQSLQEIQKDLREIKKEQGVLLEKVLENSD